LPALDYSHAAEYAVWPNVIGRCPAFKRLYQCRAKSVFSVINQFRGATHKTTPFQNKKGARQGALNAFSIGQLHLYNLAHNRL
jgi:hypothetical protein